MTTKARKLARDHVEWQLNLLRPLLISYFIHGYKHGQEDQKDQEDEFVVRTFCGPKSDFMRAQ